MVNTKGSLLLLITALHSCGWGIPRAVLFHVFVFVLTWPVIQMGGGSEERKKGRQRGIEGVASIVNEKITVASPVERMPSRNDLALLEPANTSRELGSKYS